MKIIVLGMLMAFCVSTSFAAVNKDNGYRVGRKFEISDQARRSLSALMDTQALLSKKNLIKQ